MIPLINCRSIGGLFLLLLISTSCGRYIVPDRTAFGLQEDGIPEPDLSQYQSVQLRPNQDSSLAVAVAISGGGARAANFAMGVLLGLERIYLDNGRDLLDEVDYLSTVSGGGFAGGAYVNARYEHLRNQSPGADFQLQTAWENQIQKALAYDYAALLVRANFNPRLWLSYADDGDALERGINERVLNNPRRSDQRSLQLGDMFVPRVSPQRPLLPMLFTNSTSIKSSAIVPFSPSVLAAYGVNGYTHQLRLVKSDTLDPYSIPVSVGIKSSGSFPALISNTTLHSSYNADKPYLHLYDGAVADNLGYRTAITVLEQDVASRKLLLVIDADNTGGAKAFSSRRGAFWGLSILPRVAVSGITSQQLLLDDNLEDACSLINADWLRFDFTHFIKNNPAGVPSKLHRKRDRKRLIERLRNENVSLSDEEKQALFDLLNNVNTKYSIKPDEQELLILAGQWMVRDREEEIKAILEVD